MVNPHRHDDALAVDSPATSLPLVSLQIIGSRQSGGAERFYVRLCEALQEAGQEVIAVCPPGSATAIELAQKVPVRPVKMRSVWDPIARWQLRRLIHDVQPDIVQTWMGRATRLVSLPRGGQPVHVARLGGYYDLKGYRHAHTWIGNTQGICDYLVREGLPASRVFHIGNFIEPASPLADAFLDACRRDWGVPDDAWVLAAAGRLHPNKGFADLLGAFAALPATIAERPLHLVIAGDGPLRESLHRQAIALGIDTRVHWLGWQQELSPLLFLADVFICPSRHEPLGNVILEAWAHRAPLVTTATAGALELVQNDENGLVTPVGDVAALARAIRALLQASMADRARLAENGLQILIRFHSKEAIVTAYQHLYQELASCAA